MWEAKDVVTPTMLNMRCDAGNTSCYAFDALSQCFTKHIANNRNSLDMCLIADEEVTELGETNI